jgi:hypothetical protein
MPGGRHYQEPEMSRARNFIITIAAFTAVLGLSSVAHAQYGQPPPPGYGYPPPGYPPPPPPPPDGTYREGFIIGFTLGAGEIGCSDCGDDSSYGGVGLSFHIGGMITPTIAILMDAFAVSHPEEEGTVSVSMVTVAGRLFLGNVAWVELGLGGGELGLSRNNGDSYNTDMGAAFLVAGGVEVFHNGNFALDLSLHAGATNIDDPLVGKLTATSATFNVGINWY